MEINGAAQGFRLTLCRCGASANKPYCDGSHATAGFVASGEVPAATSEPLSQRDGPVSINPIPDGPLRVIGNLEVVCGTGRTVNRVTQCALCRCGHSMNKPYCDGSHKAAGFRA
jgi:CDGSH-type Zn-finger protein